METKTHNSYSGRDVLALYPMVKKIKHRDQKVGEQNL
jgi:hypothetical protein